MRKPPRLQAIHEIVRLPASIAALAGLAACAQAGSSSVSPASLQTLAQTAHQSLPAAGRVRADALHCPPSVVFVVSERSSVEIYDPAKLKAGPCGSITGFGIPSGLFVDGAGNLWVTDASAKQIFEFAPGAHAPALTLDDSNGVPVDVAVDATSKTVYVTDYQNSSDPHVLVEVYANGSTTPTGTLSDPEARNGGYDTVDDHGNLYVTFMTESNKAKVDRWIGGAGDPQDLHLALISGGGIATTADGALAVCDPFDFRCGVFERGATTMSHVFAHMGRRMRGPADKPPWLHPDTLALERDEHVAYVAAETLSSWRYPGPVNRRNHLPLTEVKVPDLAGQGIAVRPAAKPGSPY
jgi:hypothetical protein